MSQCNGYGRKTGWIWAVVVLLLLAGCRQEPTPTPTPEPTATEIVQQAITRLTTTPGFHFTVDLSGAPAYLDNTGQLSFRTAVGDYAAPDKAQATVRAAAFGLITDVNVISIGENQWQTNLLTKQWEQLPPDWGFNPGSLFDPANGLPAILTQDIINATMTGRETLEDGSDQELIVITGEVAGERLAGISGGLIGPQTVTVTLWIVPETYEIHRILVNEPEPDAAEPSLWQLDFSQYDQEMEIAPPQ